MSSRSTSPRPWTRHSPPARASVGEILRGYRPEEAAVVFGYFARAAGACQHATDQLAES
ncbi:MULTISPECIES: hypothetical protein [Amycolatopsis]|uniref:hypothetical protein n=1 Tax=Amycolatopsis TaxID=1813 RepID=UPI000A9F21A6|nr:MULTISPECIES: hypothetical protein [Amycolatopsis]